MIEGREPFLRGEKIFAEGSFSTIHEIKSHPDYISKEVNLSHEDTLTYQERQRKFEKNLKIFQEKFSKFIPEFQVVYSAGTRGNNHKAEIPVILMTKVEKCAVIETSDINKYLDEFDEFLELVIKTYIETFDNGDGWYGKEGFSPDLRRSNNLMYGSTIKDEQPRTYYVDLYPSFYETRSELRDRINTIINRSIKYGKISINNTIYDIDKSEDHQKLFPKTLKILEELNNLK